MKRIKAKKPNLFSNPKGNITEIELAGQKFKEK